MLHFNHGKNVDLGLLFKVIQVTFKHTPSEKLEWATTGVKWQHSGTYMLRLVENKVMVLNYKVV